jgi:hypothetical protein
MHGESKQGGYPLDSYAEHLVVLQVAGVARGGKRTDLLGSSGGAARPFSQPR